MKTFAKFIPSLVVLAWIALSVATYLKVCGLETALRGRSVPVAASKEKGPENVPGPSPDGSVRLQGLLFGSLSLGGDGGAQGDNTSRAENAD